MSDQNGNAVKMNEVEMRGDYLLEQRVARLRKLLEVNAPNLFVAREILLIQRAMWLRDPDAMSMAILDQERTRSRKESGFCVSSDCSNRNQADSEYCGPCVQGTEDELGDPNPDLN